MTTSIWDEIKDLFKTDKQLEEERQRKINDALDAENSVVDKLKDLEKQYNDSLPKDEEPDLNSLFPKDSGLKEIEYTPRSDDDIISAAKKENSYDTSVKKKPNRRQVCKSGECARVGQKNPQKKILPKVMQILKNSILNSVKIRSTIR